MSQRLWLMSLQPVVGFHSTSIQCARLEIVSRDGTSVMNMLVTGEEAEEAMKEPPKPAIEEPAPLVGEEHLPTQLVPIKEKAVAIEDDGVKFVEAINEMVIPAILINRAIPGETPTLEVNPEVENATKQPHHATRVSLSDSAKHPRFATSPL
ncbi:hypothetical protein ZIOFF_000840 [Zingiber officinale]|uniref:Uncharacterized protein n=1 Tax=Zingiber officinale TaxID=94328 RepID=A0A8J5HU42_ZINOF|nr:hypothetical protein ZIOFF_000840 [Zingiber officinale]